MIESTEIDKPERVLRAGGQYVNSRNMLPNNQMGKFVPAKNGGDSSHNNKKKKKKKKK